MSLRFKEYLFVIGWLLLCCVGLFPETFFQGKVFFFADNYSLLFPGKIFLIHQLQQGVIPFWNPYSLSGTPFFADMGQSAGYASTFLFYFFPTAIAGTISIIVHLIFSAVGVYWLSRQLGAKKLGALLSGTIWIFSQPIVVAVNNLAALQSLAWIPWIVGCFYVFDTRRYMKLLLPLVIAASFLGGHPQPTIVGLTIGCLVYFFHSESGFVKRMLTIITLGLITIGLTAFQLVPSLQLARLSTRVSMPIVESLELSTHPLHFLDLILPTIFSNPQRGMVWGINWNSPAKHGVFITYFGLICLVILFSRYRKLAHSLRVLLIIALGCALLSLGKYLPGFSWFYSHTPGTSFFRNLSLILYGWSLTTSVLIGLGTDRTYTWLTRVQSVYWIILNGVAIILFGLSFCIDVWFPGLWGLVSSALSSAFHMYDRDKIILENLLGFASLSLFCFSLVWMRKQNSASRYFFVLLTTINMLFVAKTTVFLAPQSIYQQNVSPSPSSWLLTHTDSRQWRTLSTNDYIPYTGLSVYWQNMLIRPPFGESRYTAQEEKTYSELLNRRDTLAPGWQMVNEVPSIEGYVTFVPQLVAGYWNNNEMTGNVNSIKAVSFADRRLIDQGVRYFLVDKKIVAQQIPAELAQFSILLQTNDWAILENPKALPVIRYASYPQGNITLLPSTVNEIQFEAESATPGAVLIKVTPYPGWSCIMDGQTCLIQADGLGMKLATPAGKHVYRLSFTPTGWPYIAWISGISWAIYLSGLAYIVSRRRQTTIL